MKLFLNEDQITQLLQFSRVRKRDHAIFHVALASGLRAGDLLRLERRDVEGPQGAILRSLRVTQQKTHRVVERTLPDACRAAIAAYLSLRLDLNPFLFCSESNSSRGKVRPMNRSSLHRIFKRYLSLAFSEEQLRRNACHVTRRSVAKIVSDKAGRIEPAARFLGHTSVANTVRYLDMDGYGKLADDIVGNLPWS